MIKIEFPADRPDIALALGTALTEIAKLQVGKQAAAPKPVEESTVAESTESQPVATEHEHTGTAQTAETSSTDPSTSSAPASLFDQSDATDLDEKGVPFNAEFCGKAKDPFYGSGKRKGQWKKRKGVDDAVYDAWYAQELSNAASPGDTTAAEPAPVDTAGAFGGAPTQQAPANAAPQGEPAPADCGSFMGWCSAKQAAGLLTQDDIGQAYAGANIQVTDLFPPNDEQTVAQHVATLFNVLAPIAASREGV